MKAKYRNIIIGGLAAAGLTTGIILTSGGSKNYYVSNEGSDNNSGSKSAPFKNISKANSLTDVDTVFFKGGDEFFGTIKPATAGMVISSYGEGRATISGFKNVNEWRDLGNNLWESAEQVSALSYINLVVMDGVPVHKGTYPDRDAANGGYLKITNHSGKTAITDNLLPSGFEIPTGSEIVVRCEQWVIDRNKVTGHSGNTIYYTAGTYEPENGMGYFLQNAVKFCTRKGEWYYNPSTHKLTMYSTTEPENVKVAAIENLLYTQGKSDLTIDNINFEGSATDAIVIGSSFRFKMNNVDITYCGDDGIWTNTKTNDIKLTNIKVQYALNMGIETHCNDIFIDGFKVYDTNPLVGHGANGDGSKGTAISFRDFDRNATLINGEIMRSGNCAFSWKNSADATECNNLLVENVIADSALLLKSDQGAFYSHVGTVNHPRYYNRVFRNVTITNSIGNKDGTVKSFHSGFGFYGDIGSTDITLLNVKIYGSGRAGLFLNFGAQRWSVKDCEFKNNGNGMAKDSRGCQIYINESDTRRVMNNVFEGNIIEASENRKLIYVDNSTGYQKADIGTVNSNKYSCPALYATSAFITRTKSGTIKRTFASWRGLGYDLNSDIILK